MINCYKLTRNKTLFKNNFSNFDKSGRQFYFNSEYLDFRNSSS